MVVKLRSTKVIIDGEVKEILPKPLPSNPVDGYYCIDSSDGKFKVYSESKSRWIILGDADDVVFDNSSNGFTSNNVQDAIEESRDLITGTVFSQTFFVDSIVFGTDYMSYGDELATTDEIPYIIPFNCKLIAITYCNEDDNTDTTIDIRKANYNSGNSDSSVLTQNLINVRSASLSDFTPISFNAGDKLAVTLSDNGTNPDEPRVTLFFQIVNNTKQNLTENWSGDF